MRIDLMKSKIHRVKITQAELHYVGSITIDEDLMDAANIIGHKYITIPMALHPTLDEWKAAADKFNKIGEACKAAEVSLGIFIPEFVLLLRYVDRLFGKLSR